MKLEREQVVKWMTGFQAVEDADYEDLIRQGPKPEWSIPLALSMIAAAEQTHGRRLADPFREEEDERVRATWARLRQRMAA
jgi:thymidylate kinase